MGHKVKKLFNSLQEVDVENTATTYYGVPHNGCKRANVRRRPYELTKLSSFIAISSEDAGFRAAMTECEKGFKRNYLFHFRGMAFQLYNPLRTVYKWKIPLSPHTPDLLVEVLNQIEKSAHFDLLKDLHEELSLIHSHSQLKD